MWIIENIAWLGYVKLSQVEQLIADKLCPRLKNVTTCPTCSFYWDIPGLFWIYFPLCDTFTFLLIKIIMVNYITQERSSIIHSITLLTEKIPAPSGN